MTRFIPGSFDVTGINRCFLACFFLVNTNLCNLPLPLSLPPDSLSLSLAELSELPLWMEVEEEEEPYRRFTKARGRSCWGLAMASNASSGLSTPPLPAWTPSLPSPSRRISLRSNLSVLKWTGSGDPLLPSLTAISGKGDFESSFGVSVGINCSPFILPNFWWFGSHLSDCYVAALWWNFFLYLDTLPNALGFIHQITLNLKKFDWWRSYDIHKLCCEHALYC